MHSSDPVVSCICLEQITHLPPPPRKKALEDTHKEQCDPIRKFYITRVDNLVLVFFPFCVECIMGDDLRGSASVKNIFNGENLNSSSGELILI